MSDYVGKRITIRFCTQDVINLIEKLPKGYKSMIVESAVETYSKSEVGKILLAQLEKRNKTQVRVQRHSKPNENIDRDQLNGDFNS